MHYMEEGRENEDNFPSANEEVHLDRKSIWYKLVGWPSSKDHGSFTKHEDTLKKDLGLDAWISHYTGLEAE